MKPHCDCFAALCDVADALQEAKFGLDDDREAMYEKLMLYIKPYLTISCQLYGEERTIPKHHVLMHIAMDGDYMDVFSMERMNLLPK